MEYAWENGTNSVAYGSGLSTLGQYDHSLTVQESQKNITIQSGKFSMAIEDKVVHKATLNTRVQRRFVSRILEAKCSGFSEHNCDFSGSVYPKLTFTIHLRRLISYHMMQTYIPSGLFVLMSWLSFAVPPTGNLAARMTLCVVTILATSTMFSTIQ